MKKIIFSLIISCISFVSFAAPITGIFSICVGDTTTLHDATTGGVWSSSNTALATIGPSSGTVTGVSAGTLTITYMIPGSTTFATHSFTVNPLPSPILGSTSGTVVCAGQTVALTDTTAGGTWSSSNTAVGTVGTGSGTVTTVGPGTTIITYTLPTGCSVSTAIVVVAGPAPITGPDSVCAGSSITLADATTGGTWSSSNTGVATVGSSSGIVTGVGGGTTTITYTSGSCRSTLTVTVKPAPCTSGVSETSPGNYSIEVYPNPASDELTVKADADRYQSLAITNELGQMIIRSPIRSIQTSVDLRSLPSGLYYVILRGDNGSITRKFVKM